MTTPWIHIVLAWSVLGWLDIDIGERVMATRVAKSVGSPQSYPVILSMSLYLLSHLLHLVFIGFSDLIASPFFALLNLHLTTSGQSLIHLVLHKVLHLNERLRNVAISETLLELPCFLRLVRGIRILLILKTVVRATRCTL